MKLKQKYKDFSKYKDISIQLYIVEMGKEYMYKEIKKIS